MIYVREFFFFFWYRIAYNYQYNNEWRASFLPNCYIDHKTSRTLNIIYCMILVNCYQIKDNFFHFYLAKRFYHEWVMNFINSIKMIICKSTFLRAKSYRVIICFLNDVGYCLLILWLHLKWFWSMKTHFSYHVLVQFRYFLKTCRKFGIWPVHLFSGTPLPCA